MKKAQPNSQVLFMAHEQFMKKARIAGNKILGYTTPCCGTILDTVVPKDSRVWDSLTSCPHCGGLFMKVCDTNSVTVSIPRSKK